MRQKPNTRLLTALKSMTPAQQRKLLRELIGRLPDESLVPLATLAVSYLGTNEIDQMLNLDAGELMTDARLTALAEAAGLKARPYTHRGIAYYQIAGWYKDPKDRAGKMRAVTRHLCRVDKLPLVAEATVQEKIAAVRVALEERKAAVGSPSRKR